MMRFMSSKMVLVVMKIRAHLFLLVGVIVCTLLSSSQPASSFLHTPPLFPAASSTINSIRTRRTLRRPPNYDRTTTTRRIVSSLSEQPAHNSIISQLAFYPTDESFSERLKHVLSEWDTVKRTGMGKFFSDEMDAAGKIVKGTVATAEDNANRVMLLDQERSLSGEGGGDYLLKEGFHNMADTGIQLANEIRAVQQVFNELNAAKIVEEAAEDVVSTGLLMEKDLAMVVQNVVSSLKEAEEVIQLAITAVASKEGLTESAKEELTETLEAKARNIEESIKVANSVAKTAKQIAGEDQKVMSELGKTGDRLSDAIDTTAETLSETLKGVEGGEAIDAVSKIVSQTAAIVREDLSAAENIADAVGQKVVVEADAVLSIMEDKASDSVEAVRAAKTTVQEFTSSDTSESLQAALTRNVEEIRADQDTTKRLAEAIQTDALNDQEAFEVLESSSKEVNSLIDAVDGAVGKAADSVSGNNDSDVGGGDDVIADAVEKVEEQMDEVEKSMSNVMDAAEKCQDCKVKEMVEEMDDENVSDSAKGEVDTKSEEVEEDSSHDEKESKVEEVDAVSETKDEDVADSPADEKEHDLEVSSSTVEEAKFIENESIGKEEETLSHSESHHAEDEGVHGEPHELITSQSSGHAEDVGDFKHDEIGEVAQNIAEPTLFSSGGHDDGEGVRDVIESVHHHHQSDALVDSLSSVESSHSIEHVVANAARIATEVDHTTYSDTAHEFSTWSTEAVAVVIAAVSSLYMA